MADPEADGVDRELEALAAAKAISRGEDLEVLKAEWLRAYLAGESQIGKPRS